MYLRVTAILFFSYLLAGHSHFVLAQKGKTDGKAPSKSEAKALGKTTASGKDAYRYKAHIAGLADTVCYLAYHMGDKQYLTDTARVDRQGNMEFTGRESLEGGIYMIVLPNRKYFEVIVNEPSFSLSTDTAHLNENLKVTGSRENAIFQEYIAYVNARGEQINALGKRLPGLKEKKDSTEAVRKQMKALEEEIADKRRNLAAANPGTLMAVILSALTDPKRPEPPTASNGRPDSAWKFYDTRNHYWDNIAFSDPRLLRTPILVSKTNYYLDQITVPDADSINKSVDVLLDKAYAGSKEIFRYELWYVSNKYETSKYMGMDAVFTHIAERYYLSGKADWLDSATKAKIAERVAIVKPLLIGKPAPRLIMRDTSGTPVMLQQMTSPITVVAFYDPNCGHCQKDIPKLNEFYLKNKDKGIGVYAACAERNPKDWRAFVRKHKLAFTNVFDADTVVDFRKYWDVYSYPVLYVLDEKKTIIAKRVGVDDLPNLLEQIEKANTAKKKAAEQKTGTPTGAATSAKPGAVPPKAMPKGNGK